MSSCVNGLDAQKGIDGTSYDQSNGTCISPSHGEPDPLLEFLMLASYLSPSKGQDAITKSQAFKKFLVLTSCSLDEFKLDTSTKKSSKGFGLVQCHQSHAFYLMRSNLLNLRAAELET